jgi:hypothetical protein
MNWFCPKSGQIPWHRHKRSNTSFHGERQLASRRTPKTEEHTLATSEIGHTRSISICRLHTQAQDLPWQDIILSRELQLLTSIALVGNVRKWVPTKMAGHSKGRTVFYMAESATAGSEPVSGHIPALRCPVQVGDSDGPNTHPTSHTKFLNTHSYVRIHIHISWIHTCVTETTGLGKSHKHTNTHNFYRIKY